MEALKKTCKKHGELDESNILKEKNSSKKGYVLRCKLCRVKGRAYAAAKADSWACAVHGVVGKDNVYLSEAGRVHCATCSKERTKTWKYENKDRASASRKQHRKDNPEKFAAYSKEQYRKQREQYGASLSLRKQCLSKGITIEDYYGMLDSQNGVCAICLEPEKRRNPVNNKDQRLSIDHCHKTKKVRGLLCHNCNTAIGKFNDSPRKMYAAIRYVKVNT